MHIKIKLEILKVLSFDFEWTSGAKKKELPVIENKETINTNTGYTTKTT